MLANQTKNPVSNISRSIHAVEIHQPEQILSGAQYADCMAGTRGGNAHP